MYRYIESYQSIVELCHEGYSTPDTDDWHKDFTLRAEPVLAATLRAVEVTPAGRETR